MEQTLNTYRRTKQEGGIYEPESEPSSDTVPAGALTLDLPRSRIVHNRLLLFFSPPSMVFCRRYVNREDSTEPGAYLPPQYINPEGFHVGQLLM